VAASGDLSAGVAEQVLEAARVAFTQGLQVVALLSAIMAALTAIGVAVFLRQVRPTPPDSSDAPGADTVPAVVAAGEPE
jgi:DHA2 family multidrug resistance protein-like MFS transporter